ncbi:SDR family oxidoreductase [soil metagenome]
MGWTSQELPSLTGRTAVVTGGNSGIGWHTAAALGRAGATVTLACRNVAAGERAASELKEAGAGAVGVARLDLAELGSVKDFADSWAGPLDMLVNNAGVMAPPQHRQTGDGFELQLGTNHFGHFALTGRLLPKLLEAASPPRVTTVSSIAHFKGSGTVLAGNPREGYQPARAYANSKLANLLFALELQRQADSHDSCLISNAAHPGVSATNLVTSRQGLGSIPGVRLLAPLFLRLIFQSGNAGAEPTLYAVGEGGPASYTGPQWLRESRGPIGPAQVASHALDEHLASRLWDLSVKSTGVEFSWP